MEPFGTALTATEGALGFDCDVPLTSVEVMQFAASGFVWCARYLSRGKEAAHDLQAVEVQAIHMSGLAIVPVQHVAVPPWAPSPGLGKVLGHEAAADAAEIGCPAGVVLWLDLEGVAPHVPSREIIGFCNAWQREVLAAGYDGGLYVGANCGLTSTQLYRSLSTRHYWRSLSRSAPAVDVRGFQIVQSFGSMPIAGVEYDKDVIAKDILGDLPTWWAP